MKKRDHLLKKAKQSNAPDDWSALKSTKNRVTKAIKSAKKNFFHKSFRENEKNPKKVWSTLKDLSGKQCTRGVTYLEENRTTRIEDDVTITEVFNKHFTGLAESSETKWPLSIIQRPWNFLSAIATPQMPNLLFQLSHQPRPKT